MPVATPSTAEYLISSEMISSGQIRDYNEFDDDSEKIVDHQSDDSFEKIATQPNATALTSITRDTTSSSSNQSVTTKFVRGLHFTKQSECQQLKSMVTKEMTLDFIPMIESIVTDTKKGTVSLKVNLSGDETISGDVHQWYTTKMKSGLPIDALVEKRFVITISINFNFFIETTKRNKPLQTGGDYQRQSPGLLRACHAFVH